MAEHKFIERLTPFDLLMPAGYIGTLLVFPTTSPSSIPLTKFQNALNLACKRIPWLMGRVFSTSSGTAGSQKPSLEIRWTSRDTAPQIVDKGSIANSYDELARAQFSLERTPADVWPFASGVQADLKSGAPVCAASICRFADEKAIGLCFQAHHNAMDGFGYAEILNLLAGYMNMNLSENESQIQIPSFNLSSENRYKRLDNALDQSTKVGVAESLDVDQLFERHPEFSKLPPQIPTDFSVFTSEIMTISIKKIETIKDRLKPLLSTTPSTNTVACTMLWSAITRARMRRTRGLDGKTSRLCMAVNGRRRLDVNPPLTDHQNPYHGNMVLYSYTEKEAGDVRNCSNQDGSVELLADLCRMVAQAQSPDRIDAGHLREVYNLVETVDDHASIFPGWVLFGSQDLFITSWADLNLYDIDFGEGLGKPQFVRIPYAQADGNVIILPRKRCLGEVLEVIVMLRRDDLELLKEDGLWESIPVV